MKKRILFIGYNFHPEPTGIGKYSGEMMQWLAQNGYDCTVITSYPYYPQWKVQEPYTKERYWYKGEFCSYPPTGSLQIWRCPMYIPAKPTGLKRILLDFSFLLSATCKLMALLAGKPFDLVVVVVPSFQLGLLGVLYKKVRKTKLHYHIQDMQIEAARDLQMIKSKSMINALFKLEKYILKNSDTISSISEGMANKIEKKSEKNILLFPNWVDICSFYPIQDRCFLKKMHGFDPSDTIILYSGAIGEKQGLESIILTAKALKYHTNIKFIICGSGPYKEKLEQMVRESSLQSVIFKPLQPLATFNNFLNTADIHLIVQKAQASDLVMPSKLATILAVGGLALITAMPGSSLYQLVHKHSIGLLIEAESALALEAGILRAISQDHSAIKKSARFYAENHLSLQKVMENFELSIAL